MDSEGGEQRLEAIRTPTPLSSQNTPRRRAWARAPGRGRRSGTALCAIVLCLAWTALDEPAPARESEEPESNRLAEGSSQPQPAKRTRKAAEAPGSSEAAGLPVFIPPPRGAPKTRIGAGSRQPFLTDAPEIYALVPQQAGLTIEEQPALCWYLSKPMKAAVQASLIELPSRRRLLDARIEGPFTQGVHALRLADFGVRLDLGKTYQWSVACLAGPEQEPGDLVAGGGIERVEPSAELRAALEAASPPRVPFVLAEAGIWYEAISNLSERIEVFPRDVALRYQRAALLEQVGLDALARQERRAASLQRDYGR